MRETLLLSGLGDAHRARGAQRGLATALLEVVGAQRHHLHRVGALRFAVAVRGAGRGRDEQRDGDRLADQLPIVWPGSMSMISSPSIPSASLRSWSGVPVRTGKVP